MKTFPYQHPMTHMAMVGLLGSFCLQCADSPKHEPKTIINETGIVVPD
ncbi:MAG: hypothetical protein WBN18_05905 [Flavobacteriaceae bacterium]